MRTMSLLVCPMLLAICLPAQQRPPQPARPAAPPARAPMGMSTEVLKSLVTKYDRDADGRISRKEYPRSDAGFANLDRNGDGFVDLQDTAARSQLRGRAQRSQRELQASGKSTKLPAVGDVAPDFELPMLGMKDTKVKLSSFQGDRPVVLIFGSYT